MSAPRPGDMLTIDATASVQFAVPFLFRVIKVRDWPAYDGWIWIDGYQLDDTGEAIERRTIYIRQT